MRHLSISLLFALPLVLSCKGSSEGAKSANVSALVLFKVGTVQVSGKAVETGSIIQAKETITVGPQSLVDIQVRELDSSVTMRLQQNSSMVLSALQDSNGVTLSPKLTQGTVMAQVKKLNAGESFHVRLPSAVAAVRGTRFEATIDGTGNAQVAVHDGKVAVRPRSGVEDLPAGVVEKTPELKSVVEKCEKSETVVESGKSAVVDSKSADRLIDEAGLKPVLQDPAMVALLNKENATEQDAKTAQTLLAKHFEDPAKKDQVKSAVEKPIPAPQIKDVKPDDMKRRLKEYEEFVSIEQAKAKDNAGAAAAVKERNSAVRDQQLSRIEQIIGKSAETLVLKNGTRVRGVIFQTGQDYTVLTPEGTQTYLEAQVSGMEF
ncbi:MAG: FecR domain-containing protein [Leptospirales bacterium]|nr:FecR domain-containing protein [Leptospirales bacterium]